MAEGSQEQHDIPQIQEPVKQDDRERLHQIAQRHLQSGAEDDVPSLRIKSLAGLDISAQDLAFSIAATAPQPQPTPYVYSPDSLPKNREGSLMIDLSEIRWENLEAKIWHGSLEVVNPEFIGTECITAMEVCVLGLWITISVTDVPGQDRTPSTTSLPYLRAHDFGNLPSEIPPRHNALLHLQRQIQRTYAARIRKQLFAGAV